jgi:hypothetical protein
MKILVAVFVLAGVARAASIRDTDFKNFTYPFSKSEFVSVPSRPRWMSIAETGRVSLHEGRYAFPCDDPPCYLITFNRAEFGEIAGMDGEVAIVTVVFHTGGTANWEYLYVVGIRSGKPQVLAWMEAGSRADMGLRRAFADRGDLVLEVNDPDKRLGDCCSTGTVTYHYRWANGSFHEIGKPVRADDPTQ